MPLSPIEELVASRGEDDALNSENAISRMRGRLPGVGAPGSTPETDQTNLNVAAAMDRADAYNSSVFIPPQYQQKVAPPPTQPAQPTGIDMAAVNSRRNQLINGIKQGVDPDAPARYINPQRQAQLNHELDVLTGVVHEDALTSAEKAHQDLIQQRSIDVGTQSANIFKGLKTIPPNGSPESEQAVQDLIGQNRLAFDASPAVREEVLRHTKAHDLAAQAGRAISPLTPPDGMQLSHVVQDSQGKSHAVFVPIPETTTYPSKEELMAANPDAKAKQNAKGGWYDAGETKGGKTPDQELFNAYGIRQTNLDNPQSVRVVGKPTSIDPGDAKGNFVEVKTLAKGVPTTIYIPKADYLRFGGKLAPDSMPAAAPSATPAATPNITQEGYNALKSGEKYWWNGKQLTKK